MRQQGQTFLKIDIPLLIAALFVLSLTTHAAYAHAGDDHNVFQANTKSGDGYIELPVGDRIREVYSKDGDLAFLVSGTGSSEWNNQGAYIADWHGAILWAYKGTADPTSAGEPYLSAKGWTKLAGKITTRFGNNVTVQFVPRSSDPNRNSHLTFDACLSIFQDYFHITTSHGAKSGLFVRLLDRPEEQNTLSRCYKHGSPKEFVSVSTRVAQHVDAAHLYKIGPNKALLTDNSVAVMLSPDFSFYAAHPADYHFITLDNAIATEKKVMLATANQLRNSSYADDSVLYRQERALNLPQAEHLMANELDNIVKGDEQ